MTDGLLALVDRVAGILDDLAIPYVLGGSLASSIVGEPRATVDADIAIRVPTDREDALLERAAAEFYVPTSTAREALRLHTSFNVLDGGMKVDLFVLGDGLLDRRQIERRVQIVVPQLSRTLWVTSPEDQILRKLDWFRKTDSDRQWRDVVAILRVQGPTLDMQYLLSTAGEVGLDAQLRDAVNDAAS